MPLPPALVAPVSALRSVVHRPRLVRTGRIVFLGGLVFLLFRAAWQARFRLPLMPLADEDVWGYLMPAIAKLTGGGFDHSGSREWPYPAFLLANLFCFNSFSAISVSQHLLGLLTGVFILGAWRELVALVPPPPGLLARELAAWGTSLTGIGLTGVYLLSQQTVLAEHTLRPEAVFPCFGALHLFLLLGFVRRRWRQQPERAVRWGAAAVFVTVVLVLLRPAFGFAAVFANLPVFLAVCSRGEPWTRRVRQFVVPAGLAVVLLLLPEWWLARTDPSSIFLMPASRVAIHADLIRAQIAADLARPDASPYPGHDRAWLEALAARLDLSLEHSRRPENIWPWFGLNADYLVATEPFFAGSFPPDEAGYRELARFCRHYYYRAWLHQPGAMLRKVGRELGRFYYFDPREFGAALRGEFRFTSHLLTRRRHRHAGQGRAQNSTGTLLSADRYYPRTIRSLDVVSQPYVQERAARSDAFRRQLKYCRRLAEGTKARVSEPNGVAITRNLMDATSLPMLLLALGTSLAIALRPAWRTRAGLAAGIVPVLFSYNFGMCLTVAIVQTLGTHRYIEAQAVFTWFAWASGLWLLGVFVATAAPWPAGRPVVPSDK